ncbi:coiled-coil-helix-coiled-coil-helix domain containing 3a isoform X2 [Neolamprologus brichardi]|uniref:coiled-coil-helix-coiled-coil-helix domain containing 3a isoform X2 n=1 Tax=Neolamprologus brichardi TaxID=32507 RepID=UPI00164375D0|nr:coiled-coil-helix-coiled-coil-helix domain containing 3a isoform X2 [Neolamprologus brichardi]
MGANNSTRRVSFESDENDNVTVVKGIRLSENVIKRMKEPAAPPTQQQPATTPSPPAAPASPLQWPVPPLFEPITSFPPPPPPLVEPVAPPAPPQSATESVAAPPPPPPVEKPKVEPVPKSKPVPPPPAASVADEEALRKKIADELYKDLKQERAKVEQELQAWVEAEKARASAQAHAEAKSQVHGEVSRLLSEQRAAVQESLQQAFIRERIAAEDEKLRAHLLIGRKAKQVEAKEADLKKQDAFYREQVARLEERSSQFYKVTTENFHKAADQVNAKFRRYEAYPVCADLQEQILTCYKENVGKTLHCSNIAARYLQCVNDAKQNKLKTGG